jgi:acetyl esterase/lipase
MRTIKIIFTILILASTCSFAQMDDCTTVETQGYEMLLIGNSFFRPYADKLDDIAIDAGFENHSSTTVFRGGENGRPINFWNDSLSIEHNQIKAALDQGNIDYFGMTSGHDANDLTEGHKAWIEYALQNNPDITIFISLPPIDFPEGNSNGDRPDWNTFAQDNGFNTIQEMYDFYINDIIHTEIVDQLRIEFPSTKIFTIPTGWATFNLDQMNQDNELLDSITRFGPRETSIFTDQKGHQGDIVRETGGMVWLSSIYNVDLSTLDYDTGFNTDLQSIATDIINEHDSDYSLCFEQIDSPEVSCDSTYAVIVEEDIIYAEGLVHDFASSSIIAMPQKLDIYYPDNTSTNRSMYMFIHGGGFQGGTKTKPEIIDMAHYFASRGWVFASVDYRTTSDFPGNYFTGIAPQEWIDFSQQNATAPGDVKTSVAMYAAQRDNKAALRWIISNASNYNINTDFITVGGASAGAITTIALGISNQEDFRDEIPLSEDPTLSTTNLEKSYKVRSLVDFWGGNVKLDLFESIYGINRFDSNDPKLFIAHGTEDPTVLFSEAEDMVQLYDSTGVYHELYTLEGQGHGAWNALVDGKSLSKLSFDFLVERQELILDEGCDMMTSTYKPSDLKVHISPNPASNFINIDVNGTINYSITLCDIDGRMIITNQNVSRLNTISIKSGIYILKIIDNKTGEEIIKKIVVEN